MTKRKTKRKPTTVPKEPEKPKINIVNGTPQARHLQDVIRQNIGDAIMFHNVTVLEAIAVLEYAKQGVLTFINPVMRRVFDAYSCDAGPVMGAIHHYTSDRFPGVFKKKKRSRKKSR